MEVHPAYLARADSSTSAPHKARLMGEVNDRLRRLADTLARSDPIGFFCECDRPSCYAVVWMSAAAFDATAAGRVGRLTVDGHEPCELSERRERRAAPKLPAPPRSRQAADAEDRRPEGRRLQSALRQRMARSA